MMQAFLCRDTAGPAFVENEWSTPVEELHPAVRVRHLGQGISGSGHFGVREESGANLESQERFQEDGGGYLIDEVFAGEALLG